MLETILTSLFVIGMFLFCLMAIAANWNNGKVASDESESVDETGSGTDD